MQKDKISAVGNFIVKHCKVVFPVLVIVVVALTVSFALNANRNKESAPGADSENPGLTFQNNLASFANKSEDKVITEIEPEEVPLAENTDDEVFSLVAAYYNAMAMGDSEVLAEIFDSLSTDDMLRYTETAKYIDGYAALEIYTKQGMKDGDVVACVYYKVCMLNHEEEIPGYRMLYLSRNDEGTLYIRNESGFTAEEEEYIRSVIAQDDVVEFNNRVNVEYNELMHDCPELLAYLAELGNQVNKAIGESLEAMGVAMAQQNLDSGAVDYMQNDGNPAEMEEDSVEEEEPEVVTGPQYAVATTTVNVRSSDSEKADRLGKVTGGTRVEVQEVRVNGWTKVVFEGKDGYIKSEYLSMEEPAQALEVLGTVKATTSINIRAAASQNSERLGLLPEGESLDYLGEENGWCKVKYNGRVAYVKADYVTKQ